MEKGKVKDQAPVERPAPGAAGKAEVPPAKKKAEGNGEGLVTAEQFRERFVKPRVIVSPKTGLKYKIRPVAPTYFLIGYHAQLAVLGEIPEEQKKVGKREIKPKPKTTAQRLRDIEATKATMAGILCEGVVFPKVVDERVELRPPMLGELSVNEFMSNFDEAVFVFENIVAMSTKGKGQPSDDGKKFLGEQEGGA